MIPRRITTLALTLLAACVGLRAAEDPPEPSRPLGIFDVAFRTSSIDGDGARFQRYQDIRDRGAALSFDVQREGATWFVKARALNVGYRDQQFDVAGVSSRLTVGFRWTQTPLFYGNTTATAYVVASPGVLRLDPAARLAVQNGTALGIPLTSAQAKSASIYRTLASPFDLRSRRDRAVFSLGYAATHDLTLNFEVDSQARTGSQPWGAGFGFSALPEVPVPLDNRTTDVTAAAEWARPKGMIRVGYVGSYFANDVETLTWDNPVRATNYDLNPRTVTGYDPSGYLTGNGSAEGRMALAPSNHSHGLNGLALLKMPRRSSLTAAFGVVGMKQDADLIPWTVNPVVADPRVYAVYPGLAGLPRATAEAEVRVMNANVNLATRPTRYFSLTAKYRYLDRDDRTPAFDATEYVRFDAVPMNGGGISRQLDLTRNTVNVDATFTPLRYTAFRVGIGRDVLDHARAYSQLADTTFRGGIDVVGHQYVALRALYEHTSREASDFDVTALTRGGAQPDSRWYDDADRTRDRTTLLVDITPAPFIGINASMFVGTDSYDDASQRFGLLSNDNTGYTVGVSFIPSGRMSLGATYGYERYTAVQRSRNAQAAPDPSWSDPNRDWNLDTDETVHTVGLYLELFRAVPNTDIRLGYDWTDSDQGFVYGGPRIDALAAMGQFVPLPAVTNAWQRATADVRYFITPRTGIGAGYWYHRFEVNDYQTLDLADGTPRTDYIGSLMLGYGYRPFTANTGFVRIFHLF